MRGIILITWWSILTDPRKTSLVFLHSSILVPQWYRLSWTVLALCIPIQWLEEYEFYWFIDELVLLSGAERELVLQNYPFELLIQNFVMHREMCDRRLACVSKKEFSFACMYGILGLWNEKKSVFNSTPSLSQHVQGFTHWKHPAHDQFVWCFSLKKNMTSQFWKSWSNSVPSGKAYFANLNNQDTAVCICLAAPWITKYIRHSWQNSSILTTATPITKIFCSVPLHSVAPGLKHYSKQSPTLILQHSGNIPSYRQNGILHSMAAPSANGQRIFTLFEEVVLA